MQAVEKTPEKPLEKSKDTVGFSAFLVGAGTLISRILGFIRDSMIAAFFSNTIRDAWIVAFRWPNYFRRIFGEGALSVSFIPVFVGILGKEETPESREEARKLANGVFTILLAILIPLTVLGTIFAEPVIRFLTPGEAYSSIPGKTEMTVHFAQIMFVYILLVSLYAYFMAILNSLKKFWLPAIAPAVWNVAMIASAFLPIEGAKESGEVLAWAVVVGGVLQMGILVPALIKEGFLPRISRQWNTDPIRQIFKRIGPSILGLSIMQITIMVNTAFASALPEGSISWIYYADRILELPLSLFSVSLGTALLPTLSGLWSSDQKEKFHETTNFYLRSVFLLSVPSAVGVFVLARPIVDILFHRGLFTEADVAGTASVLQIYSLTILMASGVRVLAPCFYSIKNTKYPAVCSLVALVVHVIVASFVIKPFGLQGLVASTVLSSTVNMTMLFVGYSRHVGHFHYAKLFKSLFVFFVMGGVLALSLQVYDYLPLPRLISLFVTIAWGGVVYFALAHLFKLEEVKPTMDKVKRRLKRA